MSVNHLYSVRPSALNDAEEIRTFVVPSDGLHGRQFSWCLIESLALVTLLWPTSLHVCHNLALLLCHVTLTFAVIVNLKTRQTEPQCHSWITAQWDLSQPSRGIIHQPCASVFACSHAFLNTHTWSASSYIFFFFDKFPPSNPHSPV